MSTAVILAGGQARRFGAADKSQLAVGGRRLVERQVEVLRQVADHLLIIRRDRQARGDLGLPPDIRVVADRLPQRGSLVGLHTALVAAPSEPVLVVAGDMPFLDAAFLTFLLQSCDGYDAAVPRTAAGYQPLCAAYLGRCAEVVKRRLDAGAMRVTDVLSEIAVREIRDHEIARFDARGLLFFNINTPDDHRRAQECVPLVERHSVSQRPD